MQAILNRQDVDNVAIKFRKTINPGECVIICLGREKRMQDHLASSSIFRDIVNCKKIKYIVYISRQSLRLPFFIRLCIIQSNFKGALIKPLKKKTATTFILSPLEDKLLCSVTTYNIFNKIIEEYEDNEIALTFKQMMKRYLIRDFEVEAF